MLSTSPGIQTTWPATSTSGSVICGFAAKIASVLTPNAIARRKTVSPCFTWYNLPLHRSGGGGTLPFAMPAI